jgi:hypothetical protein
MAVDDPDWFLRADLVSDVTEEPDILFQGDGPSAIVVLKFTYTIVWGVIVAITLLYPENAAPFLALTL